METTIEVKIKATSPCAKFLDCSPREQIQKIKEEVLEVEEAIEAFLKDGQTIEQKEEAAIAVFAEMYDVVACVNTLHKQLAHRHPMYFNKVTRDVAETVVVNKNMARGYYAPEV